MAKHECETIQDLLEATIAKEAVRGVLPAEEWAQYIAFQLRQIADTAAKSVRFWPSGKRGAKSLSVAMLVNEVARLIEVPLICDDYKAQVVVLLMAKEVWNFSGCSGLTGSEVNAMAAARAQVKWLAAGNLPHPKYLALFAGLAAGGTGGEET